MGLGIRRRDLSGTQEIRNGGRKFRSQEAGNSWLLGF